MSAELQAELERVMRVALVRAVRELPSGANGLVVRSFPTERHLEACVRAARASLSELSDLAVQFVIGSSLVEDPDQSSPIALLLPHEAAALATSVRNRRSVCSGVVLVYMCEADSPGASGVNEDVLAPLRLDQVAGWYAAESRLGVLEAVAAAKIGAVQRRLDDRGVEDLAHYGARAKQDGGGELAELCALPLLELLPAKLTGASRARPSTRWSDEWDRMDGVKAARKLREAASKLKELARSSDGAAEARLATRGLPHEVCGARAPLLVAADLGEAAAAFAEGDVARQSDLCGLSGQLLGLLLKGEKVADVLAATEEELDSEADEPGDSSASHDAPRRESDALADLEHPPSARDEDWWSLTITPEGEGHEVALRPSRKPSFLSALLREAPTALWTRGGCVRVSEEEPFLRVEPPARDWSVGFELFNPVVEVGLADSVKQRLEQFFKAREDLLEGAQRLVPPVSGEDEQPDPEDAGEENAAGLADAVTLLDAFPLLSARHLAEQAREYVRAYSELLRATATDDGARAHNHLVPWLANLDLAVCTATDVGRARLLPTHPMMVERARLHLELGGAPPELPGNLTAYVGARTATLSPTGGGGLYAETWQVRPTSGGVQLAARLGLQVAWHLLRRDGLTRSLRVKLRGVADPQSAVEALTDQLAALVERSPETAGVAHMEVVPVEITGLPTRRVRSADFKEETRERIDLVPGDGVSLALCDEPISDDSLMAHLAVDEAVGTLYTPPVDGRPRGAVSGARVLYEPGPLGSIQRVSLDGSDAQDALTAFGSRITNAAPPAIKPPDSDHEVKGALVRAVVAREGWPVDPSVPGGIAAYEVDREGNHVVVLVQQSVLEGALKEALERSAGALFDPDSGIDLSGLREGALFLEDLRRTQVHALDGSEELRSRIRGDLGKLKAFLALRREAAPGRLVVSLDSPEGHAWAAGHARCFGSRTRADLLVLESDPETGKLAAARVLELKAHKSVPATADGRAVLATQTVVAAARLSAAFDGCADERIRHENAEGLRRLCWMGAGRQHQAWERRALLEDLDARLRNSDPPRITTECWLVPQDRWEGEDSFVERVAARGANGVERQEEVEVEFRLLLPLPAEDPESQAVSRHTSGGGNVGERAGRAPIGLAESGSSAEDAAAELDEVGDLESEVSETPPAEANSAPLPLGRLELLLGSTMDGAPVRIVPAELVNRNIMITGSPGMGKTQLVKSIILQLRQQRCPVVVLDFKNDYATDTPFCEQAELERAFVYFDGLPFNPLIPAPVRHPATREPCISVTGQVQGLAATLRATYGLGVQQENRLKDAIREAYLEHGIAVTGLQAVSEDQEFPSFQDIGERLRAADPAAYGRLDPLFDLNLFREDYRKVAFDDLLGKAYALDLSQLPSDPIKAALAKIFLIAAHAYYNSMQHSATARQFFVFDEAHRVRDEPKFEAFVRECRAYGVGVIISSQYPTDFSPEVSAALATKLVHGNGPDAGRVRDIAKLLGLTGRENAIGNLGQFQIIAHNARTPTAFVRSLHYPAYLVLRAIRCSAVGLTTAEVGGLAGFDPEKLEPNVLLDQLAQMGLIKNEAAHWRPV